MKTQIGPKDTDMAIALGDDQDSILVPKRLVKALCSPQQDIEPIVADDLLIEIEAALSRLDLGTYGICTCCGAKIELERLETNPVETICGNCAHASSAPSA